MDSIVLSCAVDTDDTLMVDPFDLTWPGHDDPHLAFDIVIADGDISGNDPSIHLNRASAEKLCDFISKWLEVTR